MNKENTKHLLESYPILYQDHTKSPQETCMCWLFECGDGWFDILDRLSKKIEDWNHKNQEKTNTCVALQVKEKFGTLRFYVVGGDDDVDDWIDEAETESEKTCEACGAPGELETKGWCTVRCKACREKRNTKWK